jgi:phosphonatase-like hydrolase
MRVTRAESLKLIAATALGVSYMPQARASGSRLRLIVLDVGGTIIQDHGDVPDALEAAFDRHGVKVGLEEIAKWRGASKREVVRHFTSERSKLSGPKLDALCDAIYKDFTDQAIQAYKDVPPIPGAEKAFQELRSAGFLLASSTGFGREIAASIFRRLGWEKYFEAMITSDDVAQGRPSPYMIFHGMEGARVSSVAEVMAVGDTPLDLQAAANGGVRGMVGVLSGVGKRDQLAREPHTDIIESVADLPELVASRYR